MNPNETDWTGFQSIPRDSERTKTRRQSWLVGTIAYNIIFSYQPTWPPWRHVVKTVDLEDKLQNSILYTEKIQSPISQLFIVNVSAFVQMNTSTRFSKYIEGSKCTTQKNLRFYSYWIWYNQRQKFILSYICRHFYAYVYASFRLCYVNM